MGSKKKLLKKIVSLIIILVIFITDSSSIFAQEATLSSQLETVENTTISPEQSITNPEASPVSDPAITQVPSPNVEQAPSSTSAQVNITPTPTISSQTTPVPEAVLRRANSDYFNGTTDQPSLERLMDRQVDSAEIRQPVSIRRLIKRTYRSEEKVSIIIQNADILALEPRLVYADGTPVEADIQKIKQGENTEIRVSQPRDFKPGRYRLQVKVQDGNEFEEDFSWGVLAVNTNKSIYSPNETAKFAMAVLDEKGEMVCDASLILTITDPQGLTSELSTDNNKISTSPTCSQKAMILAPDYSAEYQVSGPGKYKMSLLARTQNGTNTIDDSFEARDVIDFDIERITATRIYPPETYPVTFKMVANEDFQGKIIEVVPDNFEIKQLEGTFQFSQVKFSDGESFEKEKIMGDKIIGYPFEGEEAISLGFGQPLKDPTLKKIYYNFGLAGHDGIDFSLDEGTKVLSVDDGQAVLVDENGPYGYTLVIEHSWGKSYYGHLSKFNVKKGQIVSKGEEIAQSGSTGLSLGSHLHFGIKLNDSNFENGYFGKVNPSPFLGIKNQDVLGTTTSNNNFQTITWDISVKKGEEVTFGYKFIAPNISPQLYVLGPLQFIKNNAGGVAFSEARQWKLAADAPNNQFVKQGSFSKRSGTGSQSVTGVGFKPRAIIFYWTNQTAVGTQSPSNGAANTFGMGFATGSSNEAALSVWDEAENNGGASDNGRATYNNASIVIQGANGALTLGIADFTSFDADGFTLNWSTSDTNLYIIQYLALSETIISSATVNSFSVPTSGATINVSNATFQPDFALFMSGGTSSHGANTAEGTYLFGAAQSSTAEWTVAGRMDDALDSTDTCTTQRTNASIYLIGLTVACATTTEDAVVDFTQFTSNGFDLNVSNNPSSAFDVFYLALKGSDASFAVSSFNKPASAQPSSVSGTGFLPAGVMFFSRALASSATVDESANGIFALGATSGQNQEGSFGLAGDDAEDVYDPSMRLLTNKSIVSIETDADTVTGEANLRSFDTNGFTLNWTTADGTADEYVFWAIGEVLTPQDYMRHGMWFNNGSKQSFAF